MTRKNMNWKPKISHAENVRSANAQFDFSVECLFGFFVLSLIFIFDHGIRNKLEFITGHQLNSRRIYIVSRNQKGKKIPVDDKSRLLLRVQDGNL